MLVGCLGTVESFEPSARWAFIVLQFLLQMLVFLSVGLVLDPEEVHLLHYNIDHHLAQLCYVGPRILVSIHAPSDNLDEHGAVAAILLPDLLILAIDDLFCDRKGIVATEWLLQRHQLIDDAA